MVRYNLKTKVWDNHCVKSVCIRSYPGPFFLTFELNTERYGVSLRIHSECGKIRTRITPNTDTFHVVNNWLVQRDLQLAAITIFSDYWKIQKQPFRGVFIKRCSENMQQIYRRTIPKCDFSKVAKQLFWNHSLAWLFSCKFATYFLNTFL